MKIECPSCAAKYAIADEKVRDRLAKIRCRKCGATIVIDGKVDPPNVHATDASGGAGVPSAAGGEVAAPSEGGVEYSVDFGDGDQRSMSMAQIVESYNAGEVTADHYVWAEGFDDWRPLGEVDEIVEALHAAAGGEAAAPEPAQSPFAAPASFESPAAPALAASGLGGASGGFGLGAAAEPRAAVAASGRGADLFGGIDQAGSEEDVTTSAATPDLGAGGAATGARNESSVLFSLSALTSAASNAKPSDAGGSTTDDSGLIDLKALTAAASSAGSPAMPAAPTLGAPVAAPLGGMSAPLGMGLAAPPLGVAASPGLAFDPSMQQPKNRNGLYVLLAAVMLSSVGLVWIFKSSADDEAAAASAAAAVQPPPPAPTPTPTPTPTPEVAAKPPATGAEEEAAPDAGEPAEAQKKAAARPRTVAPRSASRPKSTTQSSPASQAQSKPKPKPKKSSCGCAPGDLQCAMRCAAGG